MILRSRTAWIVPAALALVGFGLGDRAIAQSTFDFSVTYDTEFTFPPLDEELRPEVLDISPLVEDLPPEFQAALPENLPSELSNPEILDVQVTGENAAPNTPFGLTNFTSNTVGLPLPPQTDPTTGQPTRQVSIFRANPADLNVDVPTPEFSDVYFGGDTDNKIYGQANDQAIFDFVEGTVQGFGVITIVGGEGIFEGASGRIEFTQSDELGAPNEPTRGQAKLDFSVEVPQVVSEPTSNAAIVGMGVIGSLLLLRRYRRSTM